MLNSVFRYHTHKPFALIARALIVSSLSIFFLAPSALGQTSLQCKPTAFPVQTFSRAVNEVQADTKELMAIYDGFGFKPFDRFESNKSALRKYLEQNPLPQVYTDNSAVAFLRYVWDNSTIFNWESYTQHTLGLVVTDLKNYQKRITTRRKNTDATVKRVITDLDAMGKTFRSLLGLRVKIKNETESIHDRYLHRAFDHLNSCFKSCGSVNDTNLADFRDRFYSIYNASSIKEFEEEIEKLKTGLDSPNTLAMALSGYNSFENKIVSQKASEVQKAASILSGAQRNGHWYNVGNTNKKIQQAITHLSLSYQVDRSVPTRNEILNLLHSVDVIYSEVIREEISDDIFLTMHSKAIHELKNFIDHYKENYQTGCEGQEAG